MQQFRVSSGVWKHRVRKIWERLLGNVVFPPVFQSGQDSWDAVRGRHLEVEEIDRPCAQGWRSAGNTMTGCKAGKVACKLQIRRDGQRVEYNTPGIKISHV